jgi:hypothetical protein
MKLSKKIAGYNSVLLNPTYSRETKIDAEWRLLVISELLRDCPAFEYIDDLLELINKAVNGDFGAIPSPFAEEARKVIEGIEKKNVE